MHTCVLVSVLLLCRRPDPVWKPIMQGTHFFSDDISSAEATRLFSGD